MGNKTLDAPSSADPMPSQSNTVTSEASASPEAGADNELVKRFCSPRFMPVRLPAPLGPKLFILGEPVLHRYYTVYDWGNKRVGFSLANNRWNTMDPSELKDRKGELPKEVDMLLMQKSVGNLGRSSTMRLTGSSG